MLCFFTRQHIGHRPLFDSICFRAAASVPVTPMFEYRLDVAILGDELFRSLSDLYGQNVA